MLSLIGSQASQGELILPPNSVMYVSFNNKDWTNDSPSPQGVEVNWAHSSGYLSSISYPPNGTFGNQFAISGANRVIMVDLKFPFSRTINTSTSTDFSIQFQCTLNVWEDSTAAHDSFASLWIYLSNANGDFVGFREIFRYDSYMHKYVDEYGDTYYEPRKTAIQFAEAPLKTVADNLPRLFTVVKNGSAMRIYNESTLLYSTTISNSTFGTGDRIRFHMIAQAGSVIADEIVFANSIIDHTIIPNESYL